MENIALLTAVIGIITSLLILRKANQRNKKASSLENEYEHFNDTIAEQQQEIDDIKNEYETLNNTIAEKEQQIANIKNENINLNNKIAEKEQEIANIKNENKEYSRILENYKNNLPIISKIEKDNSDLLFFYREYIHKIAYVNPIHISVNIFCEGINKMDNNLNIKEQTNIFGECLNKIDLSNSQKDLAEYVKEFVDGLYASFINIDSGQNKIFYQEAIDLTAEIIAAKLAEVETIEAHHKALIELYPRWKKIRTSSNVMGTIIDIIGIAGKILIDPLSECGPLPDLLNSLKQDSDLEDENIVNTYNDILKNFIDLSIRLAKTLDMDFTAIEILYQKHKEKEYSSLFKEIQTSLLSGKDINDLYLTWRKAQQNKVIKDAPNVGEYIIEGLQAKNLDKNTIDNIKEMIYQPSQNTTPPNFILVPSPSI